MADGVFSSLNFKNPLKPIFLSEDIFQCTAQVVIGINKDLSVLDCIELCLSISLDLDLVSVNLDLDLTILWSQKSLGLVRDSFGTCWSCSCADLTGLCYRNTQNGSMHMFP